MKSPALILLGALCLLAGAPVVHAGDQPAPAEKYCAAQLPFGTPAPHDEVICRAGYALDYDAVAKLPVWDAHLLTPKHAIGCVPRSNAFAADASLPKEERATPADYLHSGYDIGHMSPDADFTWDEALERQSFILTNMAPQLPGLNRQTWKYLEEDIRAWAWSGRTLWIITGPIYSVDSHGKYDRIGDGGPVIPDSFFKVIVDVQSGEYLVFVMPQREGLGTNLGRFLTPLQAFEDQVDVKIPLPKGAKESPAMWPVDAKGFDAAKKAACH